MSNELIAAIISATVALIVSGIAWVYSIGIKVALNDDNLKKHAQSETGIIADLSKLEERLRTMDIVVASIKTLTESLKDLPKLVSHMEVIVDSNNKRLTALEEKVNAQKQSK